MIEFRGFPKIARLSREIVISEKIDGTNASIYIGGEVDKGEQGLEFMKGINSYNSVYLRPDGLFLTASRTRWITPQDDNYGFANWVYANKTELMKLGTGHHFGEWMGKGINRNYGLNEKRFYLFNTAKWYDNPELPTCCYVVPILYKGNFTTESVDTSIEYLKQTGSLAVPTFMKPEGIVIYHTHGNFYLKKTIEGDEKPKSVKDE